MKDKQLTHKERVEQGYYFDSRELTYTRPVYMGDCCWCGIGTYVGTEGFHVAEVGGEPTEHLTTLYGVCNCCGGC